MVQLKQRQFMQAVGNDAEINELLLRYGVKLYIYKNGIFNEQFFPFCPIPSVIRKCPLEPFEFANRKFSLK